MAFKASLLDGSPPIFAPKYPPPKIPPATPRVPAPIVALFVPVSILAKISTLSAEESQDHD